MAWLCAHDCIIFLFNQQEVTQKTSWDNLTSVLPSIINSSKEIVCYWLLTQKWTFCHHLLVTLMSFRIYPSPLEHKILYCEECFNWFFPYIESQWGPKQQWRILYGQNTQGFFGKKTRFWNNSDDRFFIFEYIFINCIEGSLCTSHN